MSRESSSQRRSNESQRSNALHIRVHIDLDEHSTHIKVIDVRVGKARLQRFCRFTAMKCREGKRRFC
jgi:hypothetical protein